MKILFVINSLRVGGAEVMLLRLLASPVFKADQLKVVSLLPRGKLSDYAESIGYDVLHLDTGSSFKGALRLFALRRVIADFRPDIVHSWLYHADLAAGIFARVAGVRNVIWGIRQWNLDAEHHRVMTRMLFRLCAFFSKYIPAIIISNAVTSRNSHIAIGYQPEKIIVIPNGIDVVKYRPIASKKNRLRKELFIPKGSPLVGMVARFDSQKNHFGFLEAAAVILQLHPDVRFVMCGEGVSASNRRLCQKINELGLNHHINLLGPRFDVPEILNGLDVLVSPSFGEGWPNVVGEAMACGVICVVSDVGDSASVVGPVGKVVSLQTENGFANAVSDILQMSPDARDELSIKARQRIVEQFPIEAVARAYHDVYENLCACKGNEN